MSLVFEALEPSFALTGTAPTYNIRFTDSDSGDLKDPDSVDALEIYNSSGDLLRTYTPPDIVSSVEGEFFVDDIVIDEEVVLSLRWTYTHNGSEVTVASAFEVTESNEGQAEVEIKDYVLSMLGKGVVNVGLPAGTLNFCLNQAMLWYAMNIGQSDRTEINMTPSKQYYSVADDCYYVTEVSVPGNTTRVSDALGAFGVYGFSQLGMSDVPTEDLFGASGSQGFYSSLVQSLSYADMGQRVLSAEFTWEWLPAKDKLGVFPTPNSSGKMVVDYVSTEVNASRLKPKGQMLVRDYTLAEAKEALGRIRSKFSGFPSSDGDIQLDGNQLLAEATEMKRELDMQVTYLAEPGWIITG